MLVRNARTGSGTMDVLRQRVRQERTAKGMTLRELAKAAGLAHSFVGDIESGRSDPSVETLSKLADALGVSADYLLGRTDLPYIPPPGPPYRTADGTVVPGAWPADQSVKVPVLGAIRAGEPILAQQNIEDWQDIPAAQARTGRYFFLRVRGDSMEPTIREGSLALIREQPQVEDGEIAVVMVNSEEATVKRVYKAKGRLVLKADNPRYPPLVVEPGEARIIGRVAEVRYKPQ